MISRIVAEAFKVRRVDVSLGSATLVAGLSGVGKSAIPGAAIFAALGYDPEVGKDEDATALLMRRRTGQRMSVTTHLSDGRWFERAFLPHGKDRTDNAVSWLDANETTRTQRAAAIAALYGATPDEAEQNLHIMSLLRFSGKALTAAIEKLTDSVGVSPEVRVRRGLELLKSRLDALRKPVDGLMPDHDGAILEALEMVSEELARFLTDEGVAKAVGMSRNAQKAANQRNRDALAGRGPLEARLMESRAPADGAAKLAARRAAAVEACTRLDENVRAYERGTVEREAAQRDLDTAAGAEPSAITRLEAARAAAERIDGLRAAIDALVDPEDPAAPTTIAVDFTPYRNELAAYRQELAEIQDPADPAAYEPVAVDPAETARAAEFEAQAGERKNWADATQLTPVRLILDETRALQTAESDLARAKAQPWRAVESIVSNMASTLSGFEQYPDMKPHIAALRELAKKHGGDVAALEQARQHAAEALDTATAARDAERAQRAQDDELVATLRAEAGSLIAEALRIRDAAKTSAAEQTRQRASAYNAAVQEVRAARTAVEARRAELRGKIEAIETACRDAAARTNASLTEAFEAARRTARTAREANASERGRLQAEIDRLNSEMRIAERHRGEAASAVAAAKARLEGLRVATALDTTAAREDLAKLSAEIETLDAHLKTAKNADGLREEIARLCLAAERAGAEGKVWGAALWVCERLQAEEMEARAGGLKPFMQEFFVEAGRTELPIIDYRNGASFGWRTVYGDEVYVETLSGGQGVLFRAALAYAVLMVRNPPEKLLCVELAECGDGVTNVQLLRALDAIKDRVQVIVATCVPTLAPEGWATITVEAEKEAAHAA